MRERTSQWLEPVWFSQELTAEPLTGWAGPSDTLTHYKLCLALRLTNLKEKGIVRMALSHQLISVLVFTALGNDCKFDRGAGVGGVHGEVRGDSQGNILFTVLN